MTKAIDSRTYGRIASKRSPDGSMGKVKSSNPWPSVPPISLSQFVPPRDHYSMALTLHNEYRDHLASLHRTKITLRNLGSELQNFRDSSDFLHDEKEKEIKDLKSHFKEGDAYEKEYDDKYHLNKSLIDEKTECLQATKDQDKVIATCFYRFDKVMEVLDKKITQMENRVKHSKAQTDIITTYDMYS